MTSPHSWQRRWWLVPATLGVAALIVGHQLLPVKLAPRAVGRWSSSRARAAYLRSYHATLRQLPGPDEVWDIPTRFGTVRVYSFGSDRTSDVCPVVLIPGRSSGVPMWRETLPDLLAERTVYALDALGDAGLSVQTSPIRDAADQAAYLDDLFGGLALERAHVLGHSFGGWLAANFALRYPRRVASLGLLEPVFVVEGLRWQAWVGMTAWLLWRGVPVVGPRVEEQVSMKIGGTTRRADLEDPLARMVTHGMHAYTSALPLPRPFTREALRQLKMPVFLALGGRSVMHDAARGLQRARQNLPNVEAQIWPEGTHSLPMDVAGPLNRELLQFMSRHDRTSF